MPDTADLAVVGAGAAGLFAAITAADAGARVLLVSARPLAETASYWAQGGLAAAVDPADSVAQHLADTLAAGRGMVRRSAAELVCAEAPARFADLQRLGVPFDREPDGRLALGLEGGHGARRVAHAGGSATGRQILDVLADAVAAHASITTLTGRRAVALTVDDDGRCTGVELDAGRRLLARGVALATGGAAALWGRTTNPPGSYGSGLLLAHAAGAELADLELVQFHPTAVRGIPGREGFLISEAVRGEGATLHGSDGARFVDELAPRDEVAQAIADHLAATGEAAVGLDMRDVDPARFPNLVAELRAHGHEPQRDRVPVAPASHYTMGGVATDLDGHASVPGLYAIGEAGCTGLHGANRLASNSLSECFVLGRRCGLAVLDEPPCADAGHPTAPIAGPPDDVTRARMDQYAGIVREAAGLTQLAEDAHPLPRLVARSALARTESRGAHRRSDYPRRKPELDDHHVVTLRDATCHERRWD